MAQYPRQIKQERYIYQGRPVILSAAELAPEEYEIMLLEDSGESIQEAHASSEDSAICEYRWIRKNHRPDAEVPTLPEKYRKLRDDLKKAHLAALEAAARVQDTGTCNLDAPSIRLPRWRRGLVEEAAVQAGVGCFQWGTFGGGTYVFPMHVPGQAYKQECAAEAATACLSDLGYNALTYCQMD